MKQLLIALTLAIGLMGTAMAQSSAEAQPEYTHHRAVNDGVGIHAVSLGEGDPVILIHGFPQHWWMWRETIQDLADAGYQAIAIDQRGMGGSDIPLAGYDKATLASDMIAIMDEMGLEQAAVVCYDHGGGTALAMAYAYPDRVSRLAVMEYTPPGFGYEFGLVATPDNVNWQLSLFTHPDVAVQFIAGQERELLSWYFWHWAYNPDAVPQADLEVYVRQLQKPGGLRGGMMHFASVFEDTQLFTDWAENGLLTLPILAVGGEIAAGGYMSALGQLGSDVSVAVVEETGHWLVEEQPEKVSELILGFIE